MQDDPNNDPQRQGYPAAEGGAGATGGAGEGDTRRIDPAGSTGAAGGYQPTQGGYQPQQGGYQPPQGGYQPQQSGETQQYPAPQQPAQPQQWNTPYQPSEQAPVQYNPPPPPAYQQYALGASTSPFASFEANPPIKESGTAMIIEIVAGLCGLLGLGHILSGRVVPGILVMLSWWFFWLVGFGIFTVMTLGFGCCLAPVFWIGVPVASAFWLRTEMEKRWPRRM